MKTAVVAITKKGCQLALKIGSSISADVYIKPEFSQSNGGLASKCCVMPIDGDFKELAGYVFENYDGIIFVMASGIVVRSIAPYIKDKRTDPAVVVVDEKGEYCISLLSGHIGGANELAGLVAGITGGTPVITTSTDINGAAAFDVLAMRNGCVIENIGQLKHISSALVNGGKVGLYSDLAISGRLPENIVLINGNGWRCYEAAVVLSNRTDVSVNARNILYIRPKNLIIGIGCRRGISKEKVVRAIEDFMAANNRSMLSVKTAATVDLKRDEKGLLECCGKMGIPLEIVSRDKIKEVEGRFAASGFVKSKTGVSCVAEPCSTLAGDGSARLICGKTVYEGITLALSEEEKVFCI